MAVPSVPCVVLLSMVDHMPVRSRTDIMTFCVLNAKQRQMRKKTNRGAAYHASVRVVYAHTWVNSMR